MSHSYCFISLSLQKFRCGFKCTTPRPGVPRRHCPVGHADLLHWEGGAAVGAALLMPSPPATHTWGHPSPLKALCGSASSPLGLRPSTGCQCPPPSAASWKVPARNVGLKRAKVIVQQTGWQDKATGGAVGRSPDVPSWASRSTKQEGGWCGPSRKHRRKPLQTGS